MFYILVIHVTQTMLMACRTQMSTEIKEHVYLPITPSRICYLCKSIFNTSIARYQNRLIRLAFNVIDPGSVIL